MGDEEQEPPPSNGNDEERAASSSVGSESVDAASDEVVLDTIENQVSGSSNNSVDVDIECHRNEDLLGSLENDNQPSIEQSSLQEVDETSD